MRKKIGIILFVIAVGIISFIKNRPQIDEFLKPFGRTPVVLVLRDILITSYAHIKAGDDIPFELVYGIEEIAWNKIDYSRYGLIDGRLTWDMQTNSVWIADKARMIIPFFAYEGIREEPIYPVAVYIYPYDKMDSFHILGNADSRSSAIIINERWFLENERRDLRQLLSTLIHEMVHLQRGAFSGQWIVVGNIEATTQAATIETLAAMCHYRDEIACKAFWSEIEGYARGSLLMRLRMYGYEDWYDKIANLLWRTSEDELVRDKSLRHWMLDEGLRSHYYTIINNYQKAPWEDLIIEGICGQELKTGFQVETLESTPEHPQYEIATMMFDDTQAMFGGMLVDLVCRMPHGPEVH